MLRTIDLRGRALSAAELLATVPRAAAAREEALTTAARLVADVARDGETALRAQAERFDGAVGHDLRVPAAHLDEALAGLDPAVRAALEEAIDRVRAASAAQVPAPALTELGPGARVWQRWQPVRRVGVYVPGGKAVYPSSVIMNVVPAQVAGVIEVALASPPQREHNGRVHPVILAAARLLGVSEVYAMGGAGAIGAFAYGVPGIDLDPVDVVSGPGNNFVAAAKRAVAGVVGTDAEAGATEILIVADAAADARLVAADLISQAEHDEQAAAVLVTDSEALAEAVAREVAVRAPRTRHAERVAVALAGPQSAIVLVDDLAAATAFSNAYAPEHLELQVADPRPAGLRPRRRRVRRPGLAGESRRLPRGQQPCAPDRRSGALLARTVGGDVPAAPAGHRIRPGGAAAASATRSSRWRGPSSCPRTAKRSRPGSRRSLSVPCTARSVATPIRVSSTPGRATTGSASVAGGSVPSAAVASRRSRPRA